MASDKKRPILTKEILEEYYIEKNLTKAGIAEKFGFSEDTIRKKLKSFKIEKSKDAIHSSSLATWKRSRKKKLKKAGLTVKKLAKLFIEDGLTAGEIGEAYNLEKWFVHKSLNAFNIKKSRSPKLDSISESKLLKYYIKKNMTIAQVAEKLEVSKDTIRKALVNFDIKKSKARIQESISDTWYKKYGVRNIAKSKKIRKIISKKITQDHAESPDKRITDGKNGEEQQLYAWIKKMYPNVVRGFCDKKRYPHACDFYIPSKDLFIEYQGFWTHGKVPYSKFKYSAELEKWRERASNMKLDYKLRKKYSEAVKVYSASDPWKRKNARDNGLNFLEIWRSDYLKGKDWVQFLVEKGEVSLSYTDLALTNELNLIKNKEGNYKAFMSSNKIVLQYQPGFYSRERELWNNPIVRNKLVANRVKYLEKDEGSLSNAEILRGFKISGAHYGYSHFNPLLVKWFVNKYRVRSIFDPCAGWGHRLLGAAACGVRYTGVDTCKKTVEGLRSIIKDFNLQKCKVKFNRAEKIVIENKYDAVFTCPPYFDTEKYQGRNTSTKLYPEYRDWLNIWWREVVRNSLTCRPKYFAFVMSTTYSTDMIKICQEEGLELKEEIELESNRSHLNINKKSREKLVILKN